MFKIVETDNIYPKLSSTQLNDQQFRLNRINEIKDYFVAVIKERELMSKRLSKDIASFNYFDNSLIVLSVTTGSVSTASFATVIGAPVGIVSASFSLVFAVSTNKKKKHNKIVMLARSILNSMESKTSEALINNEISHKDFVAIINEDKKYRELKEGIRMMNSQTSDTEKNKLIEEGKKIGINEVVKRNETINNIFKP